MSVFIINTDATSFKQAANCQPERWVAERLAFSGGARRYGEALGRIKPGDCCLMYHNGGGVIGIGHCTATWGRQSYEDSKYYETPLADPPEYRLGVDWGDSLLEHPMTLANLRGACGYRAPWAPSRAVVPIATPSQAVRTWIAESLAATRQFHASDELSAEDSRAREYWEGAVDQIAVNAYERSAAARAACIAKWGGRCQACDLDFAERYGELGLGFVHIHHLTPISASGKAYRLDPVNDLRPLCPNCHAMVHRKDPPMSIEELRASLQ